MGDCLFCKMIAGDIPVKKLYEDEDVFAFWDINPQAPKHFLIIPKKHLSGVSALHQEDDELLGKLLRKGAEVAAANGFSNGFRYIINDGSDGGQDVFHIHMHVLGGRRMGWPPG